LEEQLVCLYKLTMQSTKQVIVKKGHFLLSILEPHIKNNTKKLKEMLEENQIYIYMDV